MFSLLITIFAIALVAALAVAVIYYGGDASSRATVRNASNTLFNQAAQINAAGTMAVANGVGWPEGAPIFAEPFVKAMPLPPRSAYVDGIVPAQTDWEYYLNDGSTKHFVLRNKIKRDVCLAVNREMGVEGIPAAWDGKTLIQCYGTGAVVDGAYTFFYDPPSSTPSENTAALAQSLTEGGTVVPGYPRLCADGSTIATGLCPAPNGQSGGGQVEIPGGGELTPEEAIASAMDGMGAGYPDAPSEQECSDAPSLPQCDTSRYHALRLAPNGMGATHKFVAIKDCSLAAQEGYICFPAFNAQQRVWSWDLPEEGQRVTATGPLGSEAVYSEGFSISDGQNVWTAVLNDFSSTSYQYIDIRDYPTYPSPVRSGALAVDCEVLKADVFSRNGRFLPDHDCLRIETGHSYSWNVIHSYSSDSRDTALRTANPTWAHDPSNFGSEVGEGDIGWYYETYRATSGITEHPFYIGAIQTGVQYDHSFVLTPGNTGGWPMAPLVTTLLPDEL